MIARNFFTTVLQKNPLEMKGWRRIAFNKNGTQFFSAAKKFPFLGASESSEEIKSLTWSWNLMIGFEIPFDIILHISEAAAADYNGRW